MTATASYDFVSGSVTFKRTADKKDLLGAGVEATYAGITVKAFASDILAKGEANSSLLRSVDQSQKSQQSYKALTTSETTSTRQVLAASQL